jgi:[acyl-carrier-protein] S-malonyltransferase
MGALNTILLNVNTPYHSTVLKSANEEFGRFIDKSISIKPVRCQLISSIDQTVLTTQNQIKREITENLYKRIDWLSTFNKLLTMDVKTFVECGAGKSLQKIARFIPGDYQIYPMNKLNKLIN